MATKGQGEENDLRPGWAEPHPGRLCAMSPLGGSALGSQSAGLGAAALEQGLLNLWSCGSGGRGVASFKGPCPNPSSLAQPHQRCSLCQERQPLLAPPFPHPNLVPQNPAILLLPCPPGPVKTTLSPQLVPGVLPYVLSGVARAPMSAEKGMGRPIPTAVGGSKPPHGLPASSQAPQSWFPHSCHRVCFFLL